MSKKDWQTALFNAVTDPKELFAILELDNTFLDAAYKAAAKFPLKVPHGFIARMEKNNGNDPLLRQVLPLGVELEEMHGYSSDPLEEKEANPVPGLLHKYHGRVLLTVVGACVVNCRFCFRREFPYSKNNPGKAGWNEALNYIARDTSISEVILSGGDPLVMNDAYFENLIERLSTIPHLQRLRIHSRVPIVLPERITPEFVKALTQTRLKTVMIVHCNHPQEINEEVKSAMHYLKQAGIALFNQSVLLKGINDTTEILTGIQYIA